ncbi:Gfo/Idh/MocA family protein [Aspergillus fijiensis CBS 313.89]|uniref:D-xylose 1-dehydrogenase (NADP(+), D-xylono-1,5-lactone-forming) n=1 Tax=Aspergillus fijiensis CBS 313.89 TaxID=1448319 RepID=A0A8G1RXB8_9EURO|nr:NAD(P)-binding protein [Aspergillus fijiensis CBS 313.89]RAK80758.1 NAD(P)-binding protein [Aspergillus fijiensis CBS 313.89]
MNPQEQPPLILTWGILSTGRIAEKFALDLLNPRPCSPIDHTLTGVASSTSLSTACTFLEKIRAPKHVIPYGSYPSLLSTSCEAVYIATPHSHHYQNAMMALEAGKHVLIEKPITVNAEQCRALFNTATKKRLFVMGGLWTRFQPIGCAFHEVLGEVGTVRRIERQFLTGDRLITLDLAGGGLLDLGIYSLNWVLQALGPRRDYAPHAVASGMTKDRSTGVDETTTILLRFAAEKDDHEVQAMVASSLRCATDADGTTPCVCVQGDKGEIQVFGWPWRPSRIRILAREQRFGTIGMVRKEILNRVPDQVYGLVYEADELARCVRSGRVESETMSWNESLATLKIMDQVRKENELWFGEEAETVVYPVAQCSIEYFQGY